MIPNEKDRWIYKNPGALAEVLIGLQQSEKGMIVKRDWRKKAKIKNPPKSRA